MAQLPFIGMEVLLPSPCPNPAGYSSASTGVIQSLTHHFSGYLSISSGSIEAIPVANQLPPAITTTVGYKISRGCPTPLLFLARPGSGTSAAASACKLDNAFSNAFSVEHSPSHYDIAAHLVQGKAHPVARGLSFLRLEVLQFITLKSCFV